MPRKTAVTAVSGAKSARTRERVLDATAHVLSRKGYSGTRLGDIAEQAGLQAPAIYYYFPSREDLIEEVMMVGIRRVRRHVDEALAALPPGTAPMDRICAAVEAHLHVVLELSEYATAVIRNSGQLPEAVRARQQAEESAYNSLWHGLIGAAATAGELRADLDPRIAYRLVMGALNWAAEWWNPQRDSLDTVTRTARSFVLHGLTSGPAPPR